MVSDTPHPKRDTPSAHSHSSQGAEETSMESQKDDIIPLLKEEETQTLPSTAVSG